MSFKFFLGIKPSSKEPGDDVLGEVQNIDHLPGLAKDENLGREKDKEDKLVNGIRVTFVNEVKGENCEQRKKCRK